VTIRVLIADDEPLVRQGLRTILDSEQDIDVVGAAEDGARALAETRRLAPDLVCMDVRMPDVDGIRATELVLALPRPPRVLVVTTFSRRTTTFSAPSGPALPGSSSNGPAPTSWWLRSAPSRLVTAFSTPRRCARWPSEQRFPSGMPVSR